MASFVGQRGSQTRSGARNVVGSASGWVVVPRVGVLRVMRAGAPVDPELMAGVGALLLSR